MKNFTKSLLLVLVLFSAKAFSQPYSSHPNATATIFIDFDGHTVTSSSWNGGYAFHCEPAAVTAAQITEIFNRVAEDYRPFDINITTDSTVFLAAPLNKRMRVIVTPTSSWSPGVGGIAYISSFVWGDDTPAFVFSDRLGNGTKYIAECVTHESGHTVGLSHQSAYDANCNMIEQYATGTGSGETSWAPVMGNSYYKNMTGWNFGPTPDGCANTQDNLTIITSQNGFGYRQDDFSDLRDASAEELPASAFSINGLISTNTDQDVFKYVIHQNSTVHLEVNPFRLNAANAGANLDTRVDIYDINNVLISTFNPESKLNVVVDTVLNAGTYYIVISGSGNSNTDGYGSLGSYTFTGFRGVLPIHDVRLDGNNYDNKHSVSWRIIADEAIKTQELEYSTNGQVYTLLANVSPSSNSYSYTPQHQGTIYYRLKVTSVINQVVYSNVIVLGSNNNSPRFTVSTFVNNEITVNAPDSYDYIVADANGRILKKGKGTLGMNRINMSGTASGLYILQILSKNIKQTERIIRQ